MIKIKLLFLTVIALVAVAFISRSHLEDMMRRNPASDSQTIENAIPVIVYLKDGRKIVLKN
jgi:cytochrome oxidase Cu insertion factor (SCO1/SenC/PrrC family)